MSIYDVRVWCWWFLGGKACVPDNYQAYHVLYAQMFGPDKAAALLHSPLTVGGQVQMPLAGVRVQHGRSVV